MQRLLAGLALGATLMACGCTSTTTPPQPAVTPPPASPAVVSPATTSSPVASPAATTNLAPFESSKYGVKIDMPEGKAEDLPDTWTSEWGQVNGIMLGSPGRNETMYIVGINQVPTGAEPARFLAACVKHAAEGTPGLKETDVTTAGLKGRQLEGKSKDTFGRVQVLQGDGYVYYLGLAGKNESDLAGYAAWTSSFKVTGRPTLPPPPETSAPPPTGSPEPDTTSPEPDDE